MAQFQLEAVQPDGATLRAHLEVVAQATGRRPRELDVVPLPGALTDLWLLFCELRGRAGGGAFGVAPISHQQLAAAAALYGVTFTPWEVETLFAVDRAVIEVLNGAARSTAKETRNEH